MLSNTPKPAAACSQLFGVNFFIASQVGGGAALCPAGHGPPLQLLQLRCRHCSHCCCHCVLLLWVLLPWVLVLTVTGSALAHRTQRDT
jgi:hypothetical protein